MSSAANTASSPPQPVFGFRLAVGLLGILLAAMVSGLSSKVPALVLIDIQGGLGVAKDDISWLTTAYSAGELAAMPFAAWFAITFSLRRFHLTMLTAAMFLTALFPFIENLHLLLALRVLHGICSGSLIPILMMAALRFLPAPVRLHGLALFAMTATLAPNMALWLAALSVDHLNNWRWAYWNVIPAGLVAIGMVSWGIPRMPTVLPRLKDADWFGMILAIPGLMLLVIAVDQGVRLDWLNSPLIVAALIAGTGLTALFFVCEWLHPAPFIRMDLLKRRNIWMGFIVLPGFFIIAYAAAGLPAHALAELHHFRLQQVDTLGLMVGLPQLILGSCVAILLYQRWVDARYVFAAGLACIATACWLSSAITDQWMVAQFTGITVLHIIGQPMAMVSLLFLIVSVVHPMEGAFLAGLVNIIRAISSVIAGAVTGQLSLVRTRVHYESLRDQAASLIASWTDFETSPGALTDDIIRQSDVLAIADVYRVTAVIALIMIPLVLRFQFIPAPVVPRKHPSEPLATPSGVASE